MVTEEDVRHMELKAKTVEAMKRAYMRAADMRDWISANILWNDYVTALHEYRLMKRKK